MEHKLFLGGFGGQGVVFGGKLLGAAATDAGLSATAYAEYSPAMRNGYTYSTVMISDETIGAPVTSHYSCMVFFDEASCAKRSEQLEEGGSYILNSSLVKSVPCIGKAKTYKLDANNMADELGSEKLLNIIMLGALLEVSGAFEFKYMEDCIRAKLASYQRMAELNVKALCTGAEAVRKNISAKGVLFS